MPRSYLRAFDDARHREPGGSGLVGMRGTGGLGPGVLYFQGLEGSTEFGSYLGANKVKLWYSECLQLPNIPLISLRARLFYSPTISCKSPSPLFLFSVKPSLCLPSWLSESIAACEAEIPSSNKSFLTNSLYSLCIRIAYILRIVSCILQVICLAPHVRTCRLKYRERAPRGERQM